MKQISLTLAALLTTGTVFASTLQCPNLKGKYFCKAVQGSHEDMTMMIRQFRDVTRMRYEYTYQEADTPAYTLKFLASDQGEKNPEFDNMIGRCHKAYYFNSKDGKLTDTTLLNHVNKIGNYEVVRNGDQSLFLRCDRIKEITAQQ